MFTADGSEHCALYFKVETKVDPQVEPQGYIFEMTGEGGRVLSYEAWLKERKGSKFRTIELSKALNKKTTAKIIDFCLSKVAIKYDAVGATLAYLDEISWIRKLGYKTKGSWCSQIIFEAFCVGGIFEKGNDLLTPAELKKAQLKSPYFGVWKKL